MHKPLPVLLLLFIACVGLNAPATAHPGNGPQPVPEHDETTPMEDFLGVWEGRWDEQWGVRFTITPREAPADPADADAKLVEVDITYEWEERLGEPWRRSNLVGRLDGGVLKTGMIELYLDPDDPARGTAIGRFRHERRAALTLNPPPVAEE